MKILYFILRIESLSLLIVYPFIALASLMSLAASAAPSPSHLSYFDILIINAFLWLTLVYPAAIIVTEIINRPITKTANWKKALQIQLIPIVYQIVCLALGFYWSMIETV